jgi:hypothetical protein
MSFGSNLVFGSAEVWPSEVPTSVRLASAASKSYVPFLFPSRPRKSSSLAFRSPKWDSSRGTETGL